MRRGARLFQKMWDHIVYKVFLLPIVCVCVCERERGGGGGGGGGGERLRAYVCACERLRVSCLFSKKSETERGPERSCKINTQGS